MYKWKGEFYIIIFHFFFWRYLSNKFWVPQNHLTETSTLYKCMIFGLRTLDYIWFSTKWNWLVQLYLPDRQKEMLIPLKEHFIRHRVATIWAEVKNVIIKKEESVKSYTLAEGKADITRATNDLLSCSKISQQVFKAFTDASRVLKAESERA